MSSVIPLAVGLHDRESWGQTRRMDIVCDSCGSENLTRDPGAPRSADIPLLCMDCGWHGRRTPNPSCPRCGSPEVEGAAIDSWAYDDLEEAREHPETAAWGYLEKTAFRCLKCRNEWIVPGEYRPYERGE